MLEEEKLANKDQKELQVSSSSDSYLECEDIKRKQKYKYTNRKYEDGLYIGIRQSFLPADTSDWTLSCLESLGISYYTDPCNVLDMICRETGVFGCVTREQEKYVKFLKENLNFTTSIRTMLDTTEMFTITRPDSLVKEMKEELLNIMMLQNTRGRFLNALEEFIFLTEVMIAYQSSFLRKDGIRAMTQGQVSKDLFVDIFKAFSKLCLLFPVPGSAWKGKMDIYHGGKVSVSSATDIVIFPQSYSEDVFGLEESNTLFIVSVVGIENLKMLRSEEKQLTQNEFRLNTCTDSSSCSDGDVQEPCIQRKINEEVLGQHGGELLLHYWFYRRELSRGAVKRFMPGMIVCGTEVTLTLLVMDTNHLIELESDDQNFCKSKATIHYTEPLDLLKKEDRDILIESFVRLNNI